MKIEYVSHSIANNFGDTIEMNRALLNYPELHEAVLEHELGHTDNPRFNKIDLKHDLKPININQWQLLKFMLLHPSSFIQMLPVYYSRKHGFVYDYNLIVIYVVLIMCIVAGITIGFFL